MKVFCTSHNYDWKCILNNILYFRHIDEQIRCRCRISRPLVHLRKESEDLDVLHIKFAWISFRLTLNILNQPITWSLLYYKHYDCIVIFIPFLEKCGRCLFYRTCCVLLERRGDLKSVKCCVVNVIILYPFPINFV
jgi:hypothetical protein